jgi:hypothetical protein
VAEASRRMTAPCWLPASSLRKTATVRLFVVSLSAFERSMRPERWRLHKFKWDTHQIAAS